MFFTVTANKQLDAQLVVTHSLSTCQATATVAHHCSYVRSHAAACGVFRVRNCFDVVLIVVIVEYKMTFFAHDGLKRALANSQLCINEQDSLPAFTHIRQFAGTIDWFCIIWLMMRSDEKVTAFVVFSPHSLLLRQEHKSKIHLETRRGAVAHRGRGNAFNTVQYEKMHPKTDKKLPLKSNT